MSSPSKGSNSTLPPPRRTGNDAADVLMQVRWFNDFYDQLVKVWDVPTAIDTLKQAGLLAAPANWFTTVTNEIAALQASVASLTSQINSLQSALDTAGILPVTASPALNGTGIHLVVHNNGGVNLAPVSLTVPDGAGTGFRALVVPN